MVSGKKEKKRKVIYTIGHSNHTLEEFLKLLETHAIDCVVDVRSKPYSRFRPHFNKKSLLLSLEQQKIEYIFLGDKLGGRPTNPVFYENNSIKYDRLAKNDDFLKGLKIVLDRTKQCKVVLLCAEKEPLNCHRAILISRQLTIRGVEVEHILADSTVENHLVTEQRMVTLYNLSHDLFSSDTANSDIINEAYSLQAKKIGQCKKI